MCALRLRWCLGPSGKSNPVPKPGPGIFFVATNGHNAWSGRPRVAQPASDRWSVCNIAARLGSGAGVQGGAGEQDGRGNHLGSRRDVFPFGAPVTLKPEDSNLKLVAYPKELPVISGGRRLTGWKEVTVAGKKLWATEIPEAREGKWFFRELWVNGERRVRARHPNKGYLSIESLPDKAADWTKGHTRFKFHGADLKAWPSVTNAEVVAMTRWVESRLPVTSVDEAGRR